MKRIFISALLFIPSLLFGQNATIKFDIERVIGEIDPDIYGVFMEPIGHGRGNNTLMGTLYDPSSPLANEDGFKTNYIDAMRELKVQNVRWPGGNYTSTYDWRDGIGPKEERPVRYDIAWGAYDTNQVGTHEWVALNRAIGSKNVACFNFGFGDANLAKSWVEYCNMPDGTFWSDLRIKNGAKEPFHIEIFCLGNEVDGAPWINGHKNAEDYTKMAVEVAKAVKKVDPSIKLVANGSSFYESYNNAPGAWIEWNRAVISKLTGYADYLSIHRYWEVGGEDYYSFMGDNSQDLEEKITIIQGLVKAQHAAFPKSGTPLSLSIDEWGTHGRGMRGVLGIGMYFNSFIRHADFVKMSNYTMMTSLLATDRESGRTFKAPTFHIFKLFSNYCTGKSVDTYVKCDTFDGNVYKDIPYLDVTTVYSENDDTVYINVVNINKDEAITADIRSISGKYDGNAGIRTICHPEDIAFEIGKEAAYVPKTSTAKPAKDGTLAITFPACSFTQIAISVKN